MTAPLGPLRYTSLHRGLCSTVLGVRCSTVVCVSSNAPTWTHLTFWFLMRRPFPCCCRRCCGAPKGFASFFVGGNPRLKMEEVIHTPGDRFRLHTTSSGCGSHAYTGTVGQASPWASCGHLAERSGEEEDAAHLPLPDLSALYTDCLNTSPGIKSGLKKNVVPGSRAAAGCCCRISSSSSRTARRVGAPSPPVLLSWQQYYQARGLHCCVPGGPRIAQGGAHTAPRDHDRR